MVQPSKNIRDEKRYFPMLAGFGPFDFTKEENILMWEKFHQFPQKIQKILKSSEIVEIIYEIEQKFHLNEQQTEYFSQLIRIWFFREITDMEFSQKMMHMCHISQEEIYIFLRSLYAIDPQEEKEEKEDLVKKNIMQTTVTNAFSQFPSIKDQMISDKPIIAKPFLQPLQPSIKNWIMVYEKVLGANKHNAIERGEFVFRSEAVRGLTPQERDELAAVLRSRDEDFLITVDMDQRKIIFDEVKGQEVEHTEKEQHPTYNPPRPVQQFVQHFKQQPVMQIDKREEMDRDMIQKEVMSQKYFQREYVTPVPNVAQSALQQEIAKNRMEMEQGLNVVNFSERSGTIMPSTNEQMSTKKADQAPAIAAAFAPNIVAPDTSTVQNNSAIAGKVEFSSNHNLPVEKIEKKSLNSTSDYYQMSPMGGVHVFKTKD